MMPAAPAQVASCPAIVVEADPAVGARWPGLAGTVREAFEERDDVDRCAHVTLTLRDGAIGIEVALPDGRSAHRSASRREDVVPALQPLLLVPEEAQSEPSDVSAAAAASPVPVEMEIPSTIASVPSAREGTVPTPASQTPAGHLRIELSALTGARIGDGRAGVLLGAVSFLDVSGWLVGFAGSVQRYRDLGGSDRGAGALELALLGGRRFRFGTMALDLTAGPAAAYEGTATFETAQPAGTGSQIQSGSVSSTVPRVLLQARLAFSALSTVHTFVGIDGDVGPAQSPDASQLPNAPQLPTWTLGLALGATVGTP